MDCAHRLVATAGVTSDALSERDAPCSGGVHKPEARRQPAQVKWSGTLFGALRKFR